MPNRLIGDGTVTMHFEISIKNSVKRIFPIIKKSISP
ncbi:hypothetical protein P872_05220 [Rhodonellum psychrophilum GCM71 = DSM 17998]|uniref:Uncharacterized protein n=1 Tax=Rhodonellum psychrophilum GCM71 = DSM 17998 TaxID=1123057 RepID=U5BZ86_9BACT|nr:hypothetical protein P872_05220 [Rhodonellum psychrophilum GCM71 = DSM 17998]